MENINGESIVESYDNLYMQIRNANTTDDMGKVFSGVKKFMSLYKGIDEVSCLY